MLARRPRVRQDLHLRPPVEAPAVVLDVGAIQPAVLAPDRLAEDAGGDELADGQRGDAQDVAGLDSGQTEDRTLGVGALVYRGRVVQLRCLVGSDAPPGC